MIVFGAMPNGGVIGRKACDKCGRCFDVKSYNNSEYCPTCKAEIDREEKRLYQRHKYRRGPMVNGDRTLYAVVLDGRRWWLPMDEIGQTIADGNFPADVVVECDGQAGRVERVGKGYQWTQL